MKFNTSKYSFLAVLSILFIATSCDTKPKKLKEIPLTIVEDSVKGKKNALETRAKINARLADGLKMTLWASDSLAVDPVAMSVDDEGAIYLTRTNRQKNSEFDIRGYRDWMTPAMGFETVEDRRKFLHETFSPEKSEENNWLKDLNNDGSHDWKDFTVEKDEVWKIEDTNNDGLADISTRILEDFNDEITDVAGALLVRDNDVFVGIGPDMWRLTDTNDDQILDEKTSIATGFAVHIGFSGHGMSGAIEGPDGKIYYGIGDIGANITSLDGKKHTYPNQGVIVRSNPDGSDFEIYAHGLRNTHEFVFDEYGNIISNDNDGDHRGEKERLVHIVEGSDAGWRHNWQFGKYTDPKNNTYKVWMDEKMYLPRWLGQAAYFIPPIQSFHNGPTGMVFNPGTALGKKWQNKFFLTEFVGTPTRSRIWAFDLKPSGASFQLNTEEQVVNGILPTGIRFGPDGALYIADWINGWKTKDIGRVWKIDVTDTANDLKAERAETNRLMTLDYDDQSTNELSKLLKYSDMRIRQKAQFALAKKGSKGLKIFKKNIKQTQNQLARVHGIWGIGQLAKEDVDDAEALLELLNDSDSEIVAQAAKILGDVKYNKASDALLPLLKHSNARVKFFAAQALGRLKSKNAVQPLLDMLASNADADNYLRHAAVLALSRIGEKEPITALVNNSNKSLRLAAVLVLRKWEDKAVSKFLTDEDEYIVAEAARAINDDWSIEAALPALANTLNDTRLTSEVILRRAINAALRVGTDKTFDDLLAFAQRKDVSGVLRGEAFAAIATWTSPSLHDRVDGRIRGEITRDGASIKDKIVEVIPGFLKEKDNNIIIATANTLSAMGISKYNNDLRRIMSQSDAPKVRAAILNSLGTLNYDKIDDLMRKGMKDNNKSVRAAAIGLISKIDIPKEKLLATVQPIFSKGSVSEQQSMLSVLGELPVAKSEDVLNGLVSQAVRGKLSSDIILDLMEAIETTKSETLIASLGKLKAAGYGVDAYKETLYGGNFNKGRKYFANNATGQCVRCHSLRGKGGIVGPALDKIGETLTREQILEALVEPSKRIAPGYGNVTVTLKDGQVITGLLEKETKDHLIVKTSDAEPVDIIHSRIAKRENTTSAMPAMGKIMTKRELRNLIEFLSRLK